MDSDHKEDENYYETATFELNYLFRSLNSEIKPKQFAQQIPSYR